MNLASLLDLPSMIVPDEVALIDTTAPGGPREITYGELREAVSQVAGLLQSLGCEPGDRVGTRFDPDVHRGPPLDAQAG